MSVCTKFSVKEIQLLIRDSQWCDQRSDLIVPNVSWGLLPYEADLLCVKKSGLCTEFEIKRSFEDFKKDFTKDHFHDAEIIECFYYVIPEKIVDKVKSFLTDRFEPENVPAIIQFNESGNLKRVMCDNGIDPFGHNLRKIYRKVTSDERAILGRLVSLRYWSVQEDICSVGYSKKDQTINHLKEHLKLTKKTVKRLSEMNGVDRWVPCSSRLPENDREVLVCHYNERKEIAYYDKDKICWRDPMGEEIHRGWIVGWTEIPVVDLENLLSFS